jgi:small-conductance mechanosensitive channel
MKATFLLASLLFFCLTTGAQDSISKSSELQAVYRAAEKSRIADSIKIALLNEQLTNLSETEIRKKTQIEDEIQKLRTSDSIRRNSLEQQAAVLRNQGEKYPVIIDYDTLFYIYAYLGASSPEERAKNIQTRLNDLIKDDFLAIDSITIKETDFTSNIIYNQLVILGVTDLDAMVQGSTRTGLAKKYADIIKVNLQEARNNRSVGVILKRIGLAILIIAGFWLMIKLIIKLHKKTEIWIGSKKDTWLKNLTYRDYTFLSADQEMSLILLLFKILKWVVLLLTIYLFIPLIFSIFPFTRGWADNLLNLIWFPFKGVLQAVWNYIPNLFSILVIVIIMRYVIRFVKYLFNEIESEKLTISGFHADWAMPTYSIVKFLLYAFMFVLIFPYLPGSDSEIFRGVSVFIGILFSLGSSSAISNIIAGIVITYMRPFKIGDRIKIGEMTGDVIEKTLLVTRLRTPKLEEITIPNSSVLSGNTINYSSNTKNEGLIIHSTVTIGYDVPWKDMHQALIDAALRTPEIINQPQPFVLQTSLDDFYVSYQINAYVKEVNRLAAIYSGLHQNIQDVCNERGIEIMSPHYRALRDGNTSTIPADQLPEGYEAPSIRITRK